MLAKLLQRLALIDPAKVSANLARVRRADLVAHCPNEWQLTLGVLRMWHRVLFRSHTIGTCDDHPVRNSWRARLLHRRPLRFPFLMAERAIAPWDFSGLFSPPERIVRHLLGAHHAGDQFVYDLQILSCYPGALEALQVEVEAFVNNNNARTRWLRDLTVFEGYHESLLAAIEDALAGRQTLSAAARHDPDITFTGYLDWCAAQPATPAASWRSFWRGEWSSPSAASASGGS